MSLTKNNRDEHYIRYAWESFKAGNKESFAFFYNEHIDALFSYSQKLCKNDEIIKDAIQEVFIDLFLKREKINTTPEKLRYYLLLSTKRNLVKKLQNYRRFDRGYPTENKISDMDFGIEYEIIGKEKDDEVQKNIADALSKLPGKQKEAIFLRFNEAMDYPEIAKILGISIESVRKQVYRALKTVRELLIDNSSNPNDQKIVIQNIELFCSTIFLVGLNFHIDQTLNNCI